MKGALEQMLQVVSVSIPSLLGAMVILVIGWLLARAAAAIVRGGLRRTTLDNRLARWIGEEAPSAPVEVEQWIAEGVFYLLMLFVLVAAFQVLGLTLITEPINRLLNQLFQFLPQLVGACALLLVAWVLASLLRVVIVRVLTAAKIDERLGGKAGLPVEEGVSLSRTIGDALYWLIFLLFLPAVLSALALHGLLGPVQEMLQKVLGFAPNLFAAAVILAVGWFVARIVQQVTTNLLSAVGADRLSEQVGLASVLGQQRLSGVVGLVVYAFILIPVLIAALDALALEAVTRPASDMLQAILQALPALFAALLLITLGYAVGRIVSRLVTDVLTGAGFNTIFTRLGLQEEPATDQPPPAAIAGYLVVVAVVLFASIEALRLVGFVAVATLLSQFLVFAGQVILGLIIFALGLYLANLAAAAVEASGAVQAHVLALAARVSILVLAGAMALRQMGVANEIITLAFGLLLGAVAVAAAIAFGLGGREAAAREVESWFQALHAQHAAPDGPVSRAQAAQSPKPDDRDVTELQ
jgi:hypothetical protein